MAVTVTSKNPYNGLSVTAAFRITRKAISSGDISVGAITDRTYTGGCITPAVTITDVGTTLQPNEDYAVEYSANLNAGTATVTVTGLGAYAGQTKVVTGQAPSSGYNG